MSEVVWGGLLCSFGHTVFYPVNPNPPRATSTHLTHLYLSLPYHTKLVWGGLRVVWGVSMDHAINNFVKVIIFSMDHAINNFVKVIIYLQGFASPNGAVIAHGPPGW